MLFTVSANCSNVTCSMYARPAAIIKGTRNC